MNDAELSNKVHILIHSLRLIKGYKPSEAEKVLSQLVIERYRDECSECKVRGEALKNLPEDKSFFQKLNKALER